MVAAVYRRHRIRLSALSAWSSWVIGLQERFYRNRTTLHLALINGEPGLCVRMDGQVIGVIVVECDSERIHAVYGVVNPDKLGDVRHFH
jgi:hypothetical protein